MSPRGRRARAAARARARARARDARAARPSSRTTRRHRLVLSALEHQRQRTLEKPFAPLMTLLQRGTLATKARSGARARAERRPASDRGAPFLPQFRPNPRQRAARRDHLREHAHPARGPHLGARGAAQPLPVREHRRALPPDARGAAAGSDEAKALEEKAEAAIARATSGKGLGASARGSGKGGDDDDDDDADDTVLLRTSSDHGGLGGLGFDVRQSDDHLSRLRSQLEQYALERKLNIPDPLDCDADAKKAGGGGHDDEMGAREPREGVMCGRCVAAKHREGAGKAILGVLGSKHTKHRYYTLDGAVLNWEYIEGKRAGATSEGQVAMADVTDVRPFTDDEDIRHETSWGVTLVTTGKTYSLGFDTELDHLRWYVAFRIARERQVIAQYLRRMVHENRLNSDEYETNRLKFAKQFEAFSLTMQKDREACTVAVLDDIDGSSVEAISEVVRENAVAAGVSPSLLGLLHELLLFPTDPTLGNEGVGPAHRGRQDDPHEPRARVARGLRRRLQPARRGAQERARVASVVEGQAAARHAHRARARARQPPRRNGHGAGRDREARRAHRGARGAAREGRRRRRRRRRRPHLLKQQGAAAKASNTRTTRRRPNSSKCSKWGCPVSRSSSK